MSKNGTDILTPVGRLVGGSCFEPNTKDAEGNPLVIKHGPNKGQPRVDYFLAIAIPKTDPDFPELWGKISNEARSAFPALFDPAGTCILPTFAFKLTDGDSTIPNKKGKKPCEREGYPGNWVLNFSGSFAPKCYAKGGLTVVEPNTIKCGYYVRIYGSVKSNESDNQPGIFLNHSMIELIGYGPEIQFGPSGEQIFGAAPVATLPAGASATPLAPATTIATPAAAMPGAPAPAAAMPGAPAPAAAMPGAPAPAAAMPGNPVTPHPGILSPPAPVKTYTVQGVQYTAEQLKASKWTDAQIAALG